VLARDQQHVHRGLWVCIFDSDNLFVMIDNFGRNVPGHDATEDAALFKVFHRFFNLQGNYQPSAAIESNIIAKKSVVRGCSPSRLLCDSEELQTTDYGLRTTDHGLFPNNLGAHQAELLFDLFVTTINVINAIDNRLAFRRQPREHQRS